MKIIKLCCCSSFLSHKGTLFFIRNIAEEALTQWVFYYHPFPLESSVIVGEHEAKATFGGVRRPKHQQKATTLVAKVYFTSGRWFWTDTEMLFFFSCLPVLCTPGNGWAWMLVDTIRYIQTMRSTGRRVRKICQRKDQR